MMKVCLVTKGDATKRKTWSGVPFLVRERILREGGEVVDFNLFSDFWFHWVGAVWNVFHDYKKREFESTRIGGWLMARAVRRAAVGCDRVVALTFALDAKTIPVPVELMHDWTLGYFWKRYDAAEKRIIERLKSAAAVKCFYPAAAEYLKAKRVDVEYVGLPVDVPMEDVERVSDGLRHAVVFAAANHLDNLVHCDSMDEFDVIDVIGCKRADEGRMMNHSQTLGMVMCFWVTFLIADWMFMIQKPNKLYSFLIACGLFLLYKSAGRTAMGTLIATTGFLFLCFMRSGGVRAVWKRRVMSAAVFATIVLGLAILLTPRLRDGIMTFVLKYNTSTISLDDMTSDDVFKTRQFLIDEQMYNFKRRPVTGWGFQVTPEVAEMVQYSEGPILTAPVEKGVWVTAILEEGGVIGWIIYVVYFLTVFVLLYSRRAFMGLGVFMMIHISNLGEMTMFSLSGIGGIMYLFLFMALVLDAKRLQGASRRPIWSWGAPYDGGYR